MGFFDSGKKKNTRATRVRRMKAKIKKLERAKDLRQEEERLRKKLESLRR